MIKVVIIGYGEMYANIIQGCLNSNVKIVGVFYDELIKLSPLKLFFKNIFNPSKDYTFSKSLNLNILKGKSVNSYEFQKQLLKLNPDIIFRPYYSIQDQNTQYTTYFRFEGTVPDPVMIDDIHPSWIYDNEWRKEYKRIFGQEFYINDFVHKTVKNGAKARIQFQGRSVKLFASCSPMCGKVKIKLDGLPEEEIDLWRKEYIRRICIWERSDLMEGDHTLVLTACLAEKKKEEKFVEIDALEILPTVICRE